MTDSTMKSTLPRLTATNFTEWKLQMKGYLMAKELAKYLKVLTPPAVGPELEHFNLKREKTAGILSMHLGTLYFNQFSEAVATEDPAQIWQAIIDHFESKTDDNQAKVYHDMLTLSFKTNDLAGFIADINRHLTSLTAVGLVIGKPTGADIKESLLAEFFVSRLPTDYASTKEILFAKRPLTIQVVRDTLMNKLRDTEARASVPIIKTEPRVFLANKGRRGMCRHGKHHPDANHSAKDCIHLKNIQAKMAKVILSDQTGDEPFATASGLTCISQAYATLKRPNQVFLDSGASHHMFPSKENFVQYQKSTSKVQLADGNLIVAAGEGLVRIVTSTGSLVELHALHVPDLAGPLISL